MTTMFAEASDLIIDNVSPDPENVAFFQAAETIKETNKNLFLTGKAGTGKSFFIKYITSTCSKNHVVLAPTGRAAINVRGQTIHSFFGLDFSPHPWNDGRLISPEIYAYLKYNDVRRELLNHLELLIIDEISMVRCDVLDAIDQILRVFRRNGKPFGGVQVLLVGDPFQLPPVTIAGSDEEQILKTAYPSQSRFYFFGSKVYEESKMLYIELKKPYRQHEEEFLAFLNKARIGQLNTDDMRFLNARVQQVPDWDKKNIIRLMATNKAVEEINLARLQALSNELYVFEGVATGDITDSDKIAPQILQLKVGAQVMILKNAINRMISQGEVAQMMAIEGQMRGLNYSSSLDYCNGDIGTISEITANHILVTLSNARSHIIERTTWVKYKYEVKDKKSFRFLLVNIPNSH